MVWVPLQPRVLGQCALLSGASLFQVGRPASLRDGEMLELWVPPALAPQMPDRTAPRGHTVRCSALPVSGPERCRHILGSTSPQAARETCTGLTFPMRTWPQKSGFFSPRPHSQRGAEPDSNPSLLPTLAPGPRCVHRARDGASKSFLSPQREARCPQAEASPGRSWGSPAGSWANSGPGLPSAELPPG